MKPFKTAIAATLAATVSAVIYISFHPGGRDREGARGLDQSPAQAAAKGLKTLSIVHFNDLHAHYDPVDYGGKSFSILSRPEVSDLKRVRVAMQRRTALRSRDYFPRIPPLGTGARFEMEAWELLAKHLAAGASSQ